LTTIRRQFLNDRSAMTAWEYGLIAAIIAVAIITSLSILGTATLRPFTLVSSSVTSANK
jgi:pilus assembly protein Flp/PilA